MGVSEAEAHVRAERSRDRNRCLFQARVHFPSPAYSTVTVMGCTENQPGVLPSPFGCDNGADLNCKHLRSHLYHTADQIALSGYRGTPLSKATLTKFSILSPYPSLTLSQGLSCKTSGGGRGQQRGGWHGVQCSSQHLGLGVAILRLLGEDWSIPSKSHLLVKDLEKQS